MARIVSLGNASEGMRAAATGPGMGRLALIAGERTPMARFCASPREFSPFRKGQSSRPEADIAMKKTASAASSIKTSRLTFRKTRMPGGQTDQGSDQQAAQNLLVHLTIERRRQASVTNHREDYATARAGVVEELGLGQLIPRIVLFVFLVFTETANVQIHAEETT